MILPNLKIDDLTVEKAIIQGGMGVGISLSGLAAAVANDGGIGVISSVAIGFLKGERHKNSHYLREEIRKAKVIIVVAGMEGALASVVGGLVNQPVIAVPTSIGYGANFQGVSALLSMLNSCASGVTVVNIDNGFGAAYSASQINKL